MRSYREMAVQSGKKSLINKKQDLSAPDLSGLQARLADSRTNQKITQRQALERQRDINNGIKLSESIHLQERFAAQQQESYDQLSSMEGRRKWYLREVYQVIEAADVIIQILDARDPMGCRAIEVERHIQSLSGKEGRPTKRLILLLNKVDMVPAENVNQWLQVLKREHPTLAFKASTQKGRGHLQRLDINVSKNTNTSSVHSQSSVGASTLLQLLKNYSRTSSSNKGGLTVGVIGYPNVGKSSVINSLKAQRVTQVSPSAGCTKSLQYVKLDSKITLVDSPGVLFDADYDNNDDSQAQRKQGLLLRNALRADQVEDPQEVVKAILTRITKEQLMTIYDIADFKNVEELLLFIAHRNGKLHRGGVPDLDEAARIIINDWNFGKIPFYTQPPVIQDIQQSTIVSNYGEAFDIDALLNSGNDATVKVIKDDKVYESRGVSYEREQGMMESDDDYELDVDEELDDDDDGMGDDGDEMGDGDDGLNDDMGGMMTAKKSTTTTMSKKTQNVFAELQAMHANEEEEKEMEDAFNDSTAYKLQQQQSYYLHKNQTANALEQTQQHGKSKAATVLSKSYQMEGIQRVATKAELKKKLKKEQKAQKRLSNLQAQEDDSDDDDGLNN